MKIDARTGCECKTDLRELARGKPCMARLEGCDGGGETTVLGHVRIIGISGMGHKAPDVLGCWICGPCHAKADSDHSQELDFLRGVMRTLNELHKMGVVP